MVDRRDGAIVGHSGRGGKECVGAQVAKERTASAPKPAPPKVPLHAAKPRADRVLSENEIALRTAREIAVAADKERRHEREEQRKVEREREEARKREERRQYVAEWHRYGGLRFRTVDDWIASRDVALRAQKSIEEAAAQSKELYESEAAARREVDRLRWEGSFEKPEKAKPFTGRPIVYPGGAVGLGKRH